MPEGSRGCAAIFNSGLHIYIGNANKFAALLSQPTSDLSNTPFWGRDVVMMDSSREQRKPVLGFRQGGNATRPVQSGALLRDKPQQDHAVMCTLCRDCDFDFLDIACVFLDYFSRLLLVRLFTHHVVVKFTLWKWSRWRWLALCKSYSRCYGRASMDVEPSLQEVGSWRSRRLALK